MGNATHDTIRDVTDKGLDAVEEKVLDGLDVTRKAAEQVADQGAELQAKTKATVDELTQAVSAYAQEKPLQAAGVVFAAGVLTTLLLTRR